MTTPAQDLICRSCGAPLERVMVDLGSSPLANSYLAPADLARPELFLPLCVYVCERCWLCQLPECATPQEIFSDYAYFSSFSTSWLEHARGYVDAMVPRFALGAGSQVVEIASNDGYLLQYFVERGIPVLGVEPAANVAEAARKLGIPTEVRFFGRETARDLLARGFAADLLLGNNVLAHVPDLDDFVGGLSILLKDEGVLTMEFPHLMQMVDGNQFDTIYHEHFSYFSLVAVERVFAAHGLELFDVEELPTHGGSLRIFARHEAAPGKAPGERSPKVARLLARERAAGVETLGYYAGYSETVRETKRALLDFLIREKRAGKRIVGYGAPAKGNTLLNYCGVRADFLDYTVDRSPHKQGLCLPGTRIPIRAPEAILETRPDYVLILPWNLRDEIAGQMAGIRDWGGRFLVAIPSVRLL
ncbi:MAG: methyltransferase domain-containing protein [Thermoanaerobaculia bacterium]|nr:methyltransferase domain-containing protein [Thermoanaerobaculia bacterium]